MSGKTRKPLVSILAAIVTCALILTAMPQAAYAATGDTGVTDSWVWEEMGDGTLSILSSTAPTGNLTLPDTLNTPSGPKSVTRIEDNAFMGASGITGFTLSSSLKSIGESAFYACAGLTSITIPANVESIEDLAFCACYNLQTVVMLGSSTSMGVEVFESCYSLNSVTLPANLGSIPRMTFYNCGNLTGIAIPAGVTSIGDLAFANTGLNGIVIPDSVQSMGQAAFQNCTSLSSATLPTNPGFTSIPQSVFFGCTALNGVAIPANVTGIGDGAFNKTSLTGITIPDTVQSIGVAAFAGCANLSSVTLSHNAGFTVIPRQAFSRCPALTGITIPGNVTAIEESAFRESGLTGVTIPAGVTSVDVFAFSSCADLSAFNVDAANTHFSSLGGVLYNSDQTELVCFPSGLSAGAFSIPQGVQAIRLGAFAGSNLTEIRIPQSVTDIGNFAFVESFNLTRVVIYSGSAAYGNDILDDTGIYSDGFYGISGSTAQAYAASVMIPFHALYAVTFDTGGDSAVPDAYAMPGDRISAPSAAPTRTGYTFGGWYKDQACTQAWDFGNDTVAADMTLYAGWTAASTPAPAPASGTTTVTPGSARLYVGGRIALAPTVTGGTWHWDSGFVTLTQNSDGTVTIKGLKAGATILDYTIGYASAQIPVTILESALPQTGQDFRPIYLLLSIAACGFALAGVLYKKKKAKE